MGLMYYIMFLLKYAHSLPYITREGICETMAQHHPYSGIWISNEPDKLYLICAIFFTFCAGPVPEFHGGSEMTATPF